MSPAMHESYNCRGLRGVAGDQTAKHRPHSHDAYRQSAAATGDLGDVADQLAAGRGRWRPDGV